MIAVGTTVMAEALITRNRIWSLLAVSGRGLSSCSSFIALSPSGVAALSRPSMFAERFITIEALAG